MRIGFDAKRAFNNTRGLGNYSRDTIRILAAQNPENQYDYEEFQKIVNGIKNPYAPASNENKEKYYSFMNKLGIYSDDDFPIEFFDIIKSVSDDISVSEKFCIRRAFIMLGLRNKIA